MSTELGGKDNQDDEQMDFDISPVSLRLMREISFWWFQVVGAINNVIRALKEKKDALKVDFIGGGNKSWLSKDKFKTLIGYKGKLLLIEF